MIEFSIKFVIILNMRSNETNDDSPPYASTPDAPPPSLGIHKPCAILIWLKFFNNDPRIILIKDIVYNLAG